MKQYVNKSIIIVTHKFVTHPDDELFQYLNNKKFLNVMHICHSFYEAPDRCSYYEWYKEGKLYKHARSLNYKKLPEPLLYIKEMFFTFKYVLLSGITWDSYIGMDGLCSFFGNQLKRLTRVKKVIYWAIDFVPKNRFKQNYKNRIYEFINTNGYKNSDEMWDLSPRMAKAREDYLGLKPSIYKKLQVVPYGMWVDKIKKIPYKDCEKNTIVFMGRLLENQGAQLIIESMPELLKQNKGLRYKIIGGGPYKDELMQLAKKIKVDKYCTFLGRVESHRDVENEIAKSCIAVAPYLKKLDKWTYYADPGKVKTYLACGVPVLLTDLPWNAAEILKNKAGMIIEENKKSIIKSVQTLMNPKLNQEYRANAARYAKSFDYATIFESLFT